MNVVLRSIKKQGEYWIVGVLLFLALLVRVYNLRTPLADWHSFRQADTASVTREFVRNGIDVLHPRYHDLSNIQSGKDNPQGYRMVEFPILNAITAMLIRTFRLQNEEVVVGRMVSISYSLVGLAALYVFVRTLTGRKEAFFATLAASFLPYSIYYSRVILPEPAFIANLMVSFAAFALWTKNKRMFWYLIAIGSMTEALLLKPYGLFLFPVFAAIAWWKWGWRAIKQWEVYLFFVFPVLPLVGWRWWIAKFSEGIPASDWLYNKDNIRFTGAFFHWIFEVRIANLILGIGMLIPVILSFLRRGKDVIVYLVWSACLLLYLVVFAGGNVQHDYYQVILIPLLCVLIGRGSSFILDISKQYSSRILGIGVLAGLFAFSLFVSWYTIRGYYNINHWEIVHAGIAADRLLPENAKIIAPYMGDTAFLYQTRRIGWPLGFDIDKKIQMGAQYYISTSLDDEARSLIRKYTLIDQTKEYVIIDLQRLRKI
ncbi:MAG TPA: hypothetical protein VJ246_01570 [Patescibacteria group bacterium]|nr:hypothetical protein [Patescibacteria group bacterium]